jgi:hypothetical protein
LRRLTLCLIRNHRGRGSKLEIAHNIPDLQLSPPSRGRGSKLYHGRRVPPVLTSPPSRGRGSKQRKSVSPCVCFHGRLLHGGVDRNVYPVLTPLRNESRLVHGAPNPEFVRGERSAFATFLRARRPCRWLKPHLVRSSHFAHRIHKMYSALPLGQHEF